MANKKYFPSECESECHSRQVAPLSLNPMYWLCRGCRRKYCFRCEVGKSGKPDLCNGCTLRQAYTLAEI